MAASTNGSVGNASASPAAAAIAPTAAPTKTVTEFEEVLQLLRRLSDSQTASSLPQVHSAMTFIDQIVQSVMSPPKSTSTSLSSSDSNGDSTIAHQTVVQLSSLLSVAKRALLPQPHLTSDMKQRLNRYTTDIEYAREASPSIFVLFQLLGSLDYCHRESAVTIVDVLQRIANDTSVNGRANRNIMQWLIWPHFERLMVHISTPSTCEYDWRTHLSSLPSLLTAMNRISLKSSVQRASLVKWTATIAPTTATSSAVTTVDTKESKNPPTNDEENDDDDDVDNAYDHDDDDGEGDDNDDDDDDPYGDDDDDGKEQDEEHMIDAIVTRLQASSPPTKTVTNNVTIAPRVSSSPSVAPSSSSPSTTSVTVAISSTTAAAESTTSPTPAQTPPVAVAPPVKLNRQQKQAARQKMLAERRAKRIATETDHKHSGLTGDNDGEHEGDEGSGNGNGNGHDDNTIKEDEEPSSLPPSLPPPPSDLSSASWTQYFGEVTRDVKNYYHSQALGSQDVKAREALLVRLNNMLQGIRAARGARLALFGSSASGLALRTSDLDVAIINVNGDVLSDPKQILQPYRKRFYQFPNMYMNVKGIFHARVPIIKFHDRVSGLECDISVGSPVNASKSRLIRMYVDYDPRVRVLINAIKFWAKARFIGDASTGTLSSFALTNMMIVYLQMITPCVLPCLQDDRSWTNSSIKRSAYIKAFTTTPTPSATATAAAPSSSSEVKASSSDSNSSRSSSVASEWLKQARLTPSHASLVPLSSLSLPPSYANEWLKLTEEEQLRLDSVASRSSGKNHESIGSLLFGFFDFYARIFSPPHHTISIRRGTIVDAAQYRAHRSRTGILPTHHAVWCIEDPFNPRDNVARVITQRAADTVLRAEFRRACTMMMTRSSWNDICAVPTTKEMKRRRATKAQVAAAKRDAAATNSKNASIDNDDDDDDDTATPAAPKRPNRRQRHVVVTTSGKSTVIGGSASSSSSSSSSSSAATSLPTRAPSTTSSSSSASSSSSSSMATISPRLPTATTTTTSPVTTNNATPSDAAAAVAHPASTDALARRRPQPALRKGSPAYIAAMTATPPSPSTPSPSRPSSATPITNAATPAKTVPVATAAATAARVTNNHRSNRGSGSGNNGAIVISPSSASSSSASSSTSSSSSSATATTTAAAGGNHKKRRQRSHRPAE